jgi:hypothetical protein
LTTALESEIDIVLQLSGWTAESILLRFVAEMITFEDLSLRHIESIGSWISEVDIEGNFGRYLAWDAATVVPVVTTTGPQSWSVTSGAGKLGLRDQIMDEMIRELRAAYDLEQRIAELDFLARPAVLFLPEINGQYRAGQPNLALFAGRMQTTATSRQVVRLALEIRRQIAVGERSPIADLPVAPLTGEKTEIMRSEDGSIRVAAKGSAGVAARLFPDRTNPPPPLSVIVPLSE